MSGVYTTAPGLVPLVRGTQKIFDEDEHYEEYIENKRRCHAEDISKYHCKHNLRENTRDAVNEFLSARMTAEYPEIFQTKQVHDFDTLCSQLQEDVAVVQMEGDKDWLTAIHLCSPNHWDPRTKIGKPFNEIHIPVPEIGRTVKNYQVMLKMIIDKEPFTRFAWGIATDTRLNHHPEPPPGYDLEKWRGRKMADKNTEFFVRVERQNLIGLKDVNAFIFTIRTYFYRVSELATEEKSALAKAVQSMTPASLEYKGMTFLKALVLQQLS